MDSQQVDTQPVSEQGGVVGIDALINLVLFLASFVRGVQGALADGKFGLEDLGQLMLLVPTLGPAFETIGQVPAQFADLDEADRKALIAKVDEQFGAGTWEQIGERALSAAAELGGLYYAIKNMGSQP